MGYVIRNYGESRQIPLKSGFISMERDQAIETDDIEVVKAFSGMPQINIAEQPGTVHPVPAPTPPPEPEPEPDDNDEDGDDDDEDEDNDDQGEDDNADENDDETDEGDDEETPEEEGPDYESMKKRDLLTLAQERNLDVPDVILKQDLIDLLKK